jgi:PadR family transcriptional regulator, regulatory protein PadR
MSARPKKPAVGRGRAAAARRAAAEATQAAERALENSAAGFEPAGRPSDVFGGELPLRGADSAGGALRRRDVFSMLVLHLITSSEEGASYGNQLIERIETLTRGAVVLNPNTIYPLLRELETRGLIEGRWEHPEKRSRRLYSATASGRDEYERLRAGLEPFLDSIIESITLIKRAVYGSGRGRSSRKR